MYILCSISKSQGSNTRFTISSSPSEFVMDFHESAQLMLQTKSFLYAWQDESIPWLIQGSKWDMWKQKTFFDNK